VLFFTKKSDPSYLGMCFFLACAFAAAHAEEMKNWTSSVNATLTLIMLPASSFWFWPLHQPSGAQLDAMLRTGDGDAILMFASQAFLLFCYLWILILALRALKQPFSRPHNPAHALCLKDRPNRSTRPSVSL
jgi:hypothetical protein